MRLRNHLSIPALLLCICCQGCKEDVLPKPEAVLRLEYPEAETVPLRTDRFRFRRNRLARLTTHKDQSLVLEYEGMKGTIFINYKQVDNKLEKLLGDAQKFSYEHVIKADAIDTKVFQNEKERVYGQFYAVSGDAASQAQFYATDSLNHFLTGSLYFSTRPNYDSIYPAAVYLQNDMLTIMETLRWLP